MLDFIYCLVGGSKRISSGRYAKPVCYSFPEKPALAWSRVPNGRQSRPIGLRGRRARLLFTSYRTTYQALQGRMQERPEDLRNSTGSTRGGGLKPHRMAGKGQGGHKIS